MKALIISPHPDDESIGCGGTIRKHVVEGDEVRVVFLTSGEKGGHGLPPAETTARREDEARAAGRILGTAPPVFWRQPDGGVRATGWLVDRLRTTVSEWRPDFVYVPHPGEMHPDHRAAARTVRRALDALAPDSPRPAVRMYEVWTPLSRIDVIVDITPFLAEKVAAIRAHRTQCDVLRFDDASLGLSRYRGEMHSWPGGDHAEVFREVTL